MRHARFGRRERGFTMVELMLVLALMSIVASMGMPALQHVVSRYRLEGKARETAVMCQEARLEAIKRSIPTALRFDTANSRIHSWIDQNADGVLDPGEEELTSSDLGGTIAFRAPSGQGDPVEGFSFDGSASYWITFNSDGSINETGSVRFAGPRSNYLQLSIGPRATAATELTKWDDSTSEWVWPGKDGKPWVWN